MSISVAALLVAIIAFVPQLLDTAHPQQDPNPHVSTSDPYVSPNTNSPPPEIGTDLGQQAPDFSLTDITGWSFSLSDHRGKVVVIDFMATWCGPCKDEMAHLREIYANPAYSGRVDIISVDVDNRETADQLRDFRNAYGDDWTFATGGGNAGDTYGVTSIPTIYIIDQQGLVSYSNAGVTPSSTLELVIDTLLS